MHFYTIQNIYKKLIISGISTNSKKVKKNFIFFAIKGNKLNGEKFISEAVNKGACVIVCSNNSKIKRKDVLIIKKKKIRFFLSELASKFYKLKPKNIIAVTGTNGKTSIAYHIANLSSLLGTRCGYSGTLGWGELDALAHSHMTTAPPVALQKQFAEFATLGVQRVALEVSSHALDQDRAANIHLNVGVFSNLTRDHLDYHRTPERYAAAKAKLFSAWPLKLAVINADDELGCRLIACARASEVLSYGMSGDISWRATSIRKGMHVLFDTPWGRLECALPVAAEFAIANVAAAIGVLLGSGCSLQALGDALEQLVTVPGRMQVVDGAYGTPKVIIDYAHTPDAVSKVLASLASQCRGRLICVVGCGGNRDRGKRPEMAQAAASLSDVLWFTSDNPRDEDPELILQDMLGGLSTEQRRTVNTVADRGAAITAAIESANSEDLVVIAGKGHESTQEIAGVKYPFNDGAFVKNLFEENA